ncbi:MAG: LPXTG cell wall anchor domain-containing protein, partial [Streptococcus mitis]|nr:LPXTG cell wall anchor domain-containing protein [Streptococcus mitis]
KDGTTTVTFPDGSKAEIPAAKAVEKAKDATPAKKSGAKELPNTGTADSTVAMVAAAASALLGLGLAGRRRKEDEEA